MEYKPLPPKILSILREHRTKAKEMNCLACNYNCCSEGGFAILENVILIYEKYKKGLLERSDYQFERNLSFEDFVYLCFDIYSYPTGKKELVVFHMKSITEYNEIISIPSVGSYWETRSELFEKNKWLNRGCIFLDKKISTENENETGIRKCILHSSDSKEYLTEKPIDCIFFVCDNSGEHRKLIEPSKELTDKWFHALAGEFPNSKERFEKLMEK